MMKRIALNGEYINKLWQLRATKNVISGAATLLSPVRTISQSYPNNIIINVNSCHVDWRQQPFATTAVLHGACWNCRKITPRKELMFCSECQSLQDVNINLTYFDVLSLPHDFDLNRNELTNRFRQLQGLVHPDKFSTKSKHEQCLSAGWSSLINNAYKTLLTPLERAQYLLKLSGEVIPEDNTILNKAFLLEMMERNEEVEEATTEEALREIQNTLTIDQLEKVNQVSIHFKANDLAKAKQVVIQMKYLQSIEIAIKNKLENLILKQ